MKATINNIPSSNFVSFEQAKSSPGVYERVERNGEYYYKYLVTFLEDGHRMVIYSDNRVGWLSGTDRSGENEKFLKIANASITLTF